LRRTTIARALIACALAGLLGYGVAVWRGPENLPRLHHTARYASANALFRVPTGRRWVALTFDDGPDPRWTPTVLGLLARFHARATFFLVGRNALAHPDLVGQERRFGEVGNHTMTHPDLELLRPEQVRAEIDDGARAIERAGGVRPHLFRPPKGFTDQVVGVVADADRYRTVFWDLTVEHFVDHRDVSAGIDLLLARVRPGDIILAHDGGIPNRARTMAALPMLLRGLAARHYRVVDIDQLLAVRQRHRAVA
jgi:peptidoglycan-N-acetylglucosamine deacetylase